MRVYTFLKRGYTRCFIIYLGSIGLQLLMPLYVWVRDKHIDQTYILTIPIMLFTDVSYYLTKCSRNRFAQKKKMPCCINWTFKNV